MNSPRSAPTSYPRALSRRGVLGAAGAIGLGAVLTACGGDSDSEATGDETAGGAWSFKDDRGKTVKLDKTPERIVAYIGVAAVLQDFGIECTGVFGPATLKNGEPDYRAGDVDVDKVPNLGNVYPQFNVEKYAELHPDLLIAQMTEPPALWYVPEESAEKIESLAPGVGILTTKSSLPQVIGRFTELAASLGADVKADRVTAAKKRFETASETLRQEAKARGGLKVMAVSAAADILYVANADAFTDLRYYKSLGVEFVTPEKTDQGGFWQELSFENADTYEADLILVDNRVGTLQPAELKKTKPTWARLTAVQAGQTFEWANEERFSHAGYGRRLGQLAAAVKGAETVTS
ncbi:ABC transporter substrate-binding protein [Streptomyces flaveus]|uniref:ABC transporter substrate-binding protein n=1 Tax=Streptomyces flaveus TaxID=66370 RepID=UPI003333F3D1